MKYITCEELYNKFPKLNKGDVKKIQEWIVKQPHLPNINGKS